MNICSSIMGKESTVHSIQIKIHGVNDAALFVEKAKELDTDVLVKRGRYCIDGKSILGVLSLDMSQGVTVEYDEDEVDFGNWLKIFS